MVTSLDDTKFPCYYPNTDKFTGIIEDALTFLVENKKDVVLQPINMFFNNNSLDVLYYLKPRVRNVNLLVYQEKLSLPRIKRTVSVNMPHEYLSMKYNFAYGTAHYALNWLSYKRETSLDTQYSLGHFLPNHRSMGICMGGAVRAAIATHGSNTSLRDNLLSKFTPFFSSYHNGDYFDIAHQSLGYKWIQAYLSEKMSDQKFKILQGYPPESFGTGPYEGYAKVLSATADYPGMWRKIPKNLTLTAATRQSLSLGYCAPMCKSHEYSGKRFLAASGKYLNTLREKNAKLRPASA